MNSSSYFLWTPISRRSLTSVPYPWKLPDKMVQFVGFVGFIGLLELIGFVGFIEFAESTELMKK
jgi:hypothetical protein